MTEQLLTWKNELHEENYLHGVLILKVLLIYVQIEKYLLKLAPGNQTTSLNGQGKVKIDINENHLINLPDTLHIPSIITNLLSVTKITDNDITILFKKNEATVAV